jgi:acyl-CoA reductase-like NAD-dependent aldehyde dehydrogenase
MTAIAETPAAALDQHLEVLTAHKKPWLEVGIPERIALLERCIVGMDAVKDRWVRALCDVKKIPAGDNLEGEEWVAGPVAVVRNLRLLVEALRQDGQPKPVHTEARADGRTVCRIFPTDLYDKLVLSGVRCDVWIQPGKEASQGAIYRGEHAHEGRVCLVLGAGNVSSIGPMDVLYKLFVENEVVLFKANPVNEAAGPLFEEAFASLVEAGVLRVIYGGAAVGALASEHASVDSLHVTGSQATYDRIVWGAPAEQAKNKAAGTALNARPFTAELGCVTPVMVVPGPWSAAEVAFQARHVAAMVTQNASYNCNAAKVVVLASGWPLREAFLTKLHEELGKARARAAYYPGSRERYDAFLAEYPNAKPLGAAKTEAGEDTVPWTALPDVAAREGEYALQNEAFCGVIAEVTLDCPDDAAQFLDTAVKFANERCAGTLSCSMLVHPKTEREHGAAVESAIADLRYGGVAINCWPAFLYGLVCATWGAYPGHEPTDIQSGAGVVHNTFLFDHPEKSVVRAPFVMNPVPPYFSDHRTLRDLGARLFAFERSPSIGKFVALAWAGMRA